MRHLLPLRYIDAIAKTGSIRRAAENLSITSTALNRRLLAMEEELGGPIFERLPRGVRLNSAGEILIEHVRHQLSDMERVKSQIADLSGFRRGHVSIACSQAMLSYFLPDQIAKYRKAHPAVTFGVHLRDRAAAEDALADHTADLALVFEPVQMTDLQTILTVPQTIAAAMRPDHPLARKRTLRLHDCLAYPLALPTAPYGVRHLLDAALAGGSVKLQPAIESDSFEFLRQYVLEEHAISFHIPIGLPAAKDKSLRIRTIAPQDVPAGLLYMGQLRRRTLPVAAARFADQIAKSLHERFISRTH